MQWYVKVLGRSLDFQGRARRTEYWVFALVNVIVGIVLGIIDRLAGLQFGDPAVGVLGLVYGLFVLLPGVAASVRRLHDTDRTGWWLVIGLVPLVGSIVLLVFYVTEGNRGGNRFGQDPKALAGSDAAGAGDPLRSVTAAVAVPAVVACVVAAWFGAAWYRAGNDGDLALATARDEVLRDAQQAATNLNTLEGARLDEGFRLWRDSATGPLLEELDANGEQYAAGLAEILESSEAQARYGAVQSVNLREGTAQVLVAVDTSYNQLAGEPSCLRQRLRLEMRLVEGRWKVAQLTPVGNLEPVPGAGCPPGSSDAPPN